MKSSYLYPSNIRRGDGYHLWLFVEFTTVELQMVDQLSVALSSNTCEFFFLQKNHQQEEIINYSDVVEQTLPCHKNYH